MRYRWLILVILLCFIAKPEKVMGQDSQNLRYIYGDANKFMALVIQNAVKNEENKTKHLTYNVRHTVTRKNDKGELLKNSKGFPDELTELITIHNNNGSREAVVTQTSGAGKGIFGLELFSGSGNTDILGTRYDYEFVYDHPTIINERAYAIVSFKTKDRGLEFRTSADEVINRAEGRITIDLERLLMWKFESSIPNEFTLGMLWFKVYSAKIIIEQQDIDGIFVEKTIIASGRYRNGWFASAKNLEEKYEFYNYRKIK